MLMLIMKPGAQKESLTSLHEGQNHLKILTERNIYMESLKSLTQFEICLTVHR